MQEEITTTPPEETPEGQTEQSLTEAAVLNESQEVSAPEMPEALPPETPAEPAVTAETAETAAEAAAEPEAPVAEEEAAEEEAAAEESGPEQEEIATALLEAVVRDDEHFQEHVNQANEHELVLLMENIAAQKDISLLISKAKSIRVAFEALRAQKGEELDSALNSRFITAQARFNKKRNDYNAALEKEKEENARLKKGLLEELKEIVTAEKVTEIQKVREIQKRWKEIGWVPQADLQPLNDTYRHYLDVFYSLRSKYNELIDMDRKYNLAEKQKLIEEIRALIPAEISQNRDEWNELSGRVKHLQEVWRTLGHVPREESEALNETYKQVLDQFYGLRSEYMEGQEEKRKENGDLKAAILEKLKQHAAFSSDKPKEWNDITQSILALQEEWKKIGPAPTEQNRQLWKDYRQYCDAFFSRKGTFFKDIDSVRNENYRLKVEICEKAEALSQAENFKETAEVLKQLQNEWKKIGPVHDRHSNKIWKRFRTACDTFFERRSAAMSGGSGSMEENLRAKEALLEKLKAMTDAGEATMSAFEEIQAAWKNAGLVPFEHKDRINEAFRELSRPFLSQARGAGGGGGKGGPRHHGPQGGGGKGGYKGGGGKPQYQQQGDDGGRFEMQKLRKKIQEAQEKIDTLETNILYIARGKSGDALRSQIQKQIDGEKQQVAQWQKRIKELREEAENPGAKQKSAAPAPETPAAETPVAEAPAAETPATEAPAENPEA